jgi:phosphatidylserine/phosphatidylglycerophosphate/cardiolipin synthase-like enzyme
MKVSIDAWLEQPIFDLRAPSESTEIPRFGRICTTVPKRVHTILERLIELIDSAKERVFLCSFLIGGQSVTDALRRAVARIRGHVYVITAVDDSSLRKTLATEPDLVADVLKRERKSFAALTKHGIYVRAAEDCHAKFCIVDDRAALIGSANFDPNGLGESGGTPCGELGLLMETSDRVESLSELFRHLWKHGCNREVLPRPDDYSLQTVHRKANNSPPQPLDQEGAIIWTGFGSTAILEAIRKIAHNSKQTLVLGTYSFTGMKDQADLILNALESARRRRVQIQLLMRDRWRDLGDVAALLAMGIEVRANHVNHAKYAIADGRFGALFSANFDGYHGLTNGVETGVWLRSEEAAEVAAWHSQIWNEAPRIAEMVPRTEISARLPFIRMEYPSFVKKEIKLRGKEAAVREAGTIFKGAFLLIHPRNETTSTSVTLAGMSNAYRINFEGTGADVFNLGPDDPNHWTVGKFLTSPKSQKYDAWFPVGLEVSTTTSAGDSKEPSGATRKAAPDRRDRRDRP